MIYFDKLLVEGFGSITSETLLDLSLKGIYIIRGPNGSGKTTIFNALYWCLYGKNIKEVTVAKLPTKKELRPKDWRGTRVIVSLIHDGSVYTIARHIKYTSKEMSMKNNSSLIIWKDDELMGSQYSSDYQKVIDGILKINHTLFLNSILLGQQMNRFIKAKPAEKRAIFESIFDLDFIDAAKLKAKQKHDSLCIDHSKAKLAFEQNAEYAFQIAAEDLELRKQKGLFQTMVNEEVAELTAKIQALRAEISTISANQPKTLALYSWDNTLDKAIRDKGKEIFAFQTQLENTIDPPEFNTTCNVCGAKIKAAKLKELKTARDKTIEELTYARTTLAKRIENEQVVLEDLMEQKVENDKIAEKNTQIRLNNQQAENNIKAVGKLEKQIDEHESKIIQWKTKKFDDAKLLKIAEELQLAHDKIPQLTKDVAELEQLIEIVKFWSSTGFGSKGMKGHIMNTSLALLNNSIRKYSSILGFHVEFTIDTTKASKPFVTKTTNDGINFSFDEFSGGEQTRLDIATVFAMHDLISNTINCNILIADETFDGLDREGKESIFQMIREKSSGKAMFIVTHSDEFDSLGTKQIDISKNGEGTIINF